jgi:hypothetical protein
MLGNFENDKDIKNILEGRNRNIILASDFNTGFNNTAKEKYSNFVNSYKNKFRLENCIENFHEKFISTHYQNTDNSYLDDFCFMKILMM